MFPAGKSGVWILYIWIFILFWKAACLQGERHVNRRIKRNSEEYDLFQGTTQRKLKSSAQFEGQRDKVNSFENIIKDSTQIIKSSGKETAEILQNELEELNPVIETTEDTVKSSVVSPISAINDNFEGANDKEADKATAVDISNVPPPLDADTNVFSHPNVPPPLETHHIAIKDRDQSNAPDDVQNGPAGSIPSAVVTINEANSVKVQATKYPVGKAGRVNVTARPGVTVTGVTLIPEPKKTMGGKTEQNSKPRRLKPNNLGDTHPTQGNMPMGTNQPKMTETMKRKETNIQNDSTQETAMPQTGAPNSQEPAAFGEVKDKKMKSRDRTVVNKPLKLVTYEQFVGVKLPKKQNINNSRMGKELDFLMKEKQQKSLIFLQNATKQADALQQTLKTHKLKLKSYMDVLKNLTLEHAEDKKKITEYTQSVRNKVKDILNPKKKFDNNHTKSEKATKDTKKPEHFLSKNITETLRARVNMADLRKSEEFWDKKGEDVEDAHVLRFENDLINEELKIESENELSSESIMADYVNVDTSEKPDDISKVTNPVPHTTTKEDESHLNDIHKADLDDVHVARDRLTGRTQHETSLLNNIVSARIHGNILAPPPERCSVSANMIRYRPPESQMSEDGSLFYRVDLQPEIDKAIEGGPMNYLSDYKNPCWLSKITDGTGSLWYDYTESGLTYKRMSFLFEMRLSKDSNWRMRCLPLLFFVGVTKSGTTDLYSRLLGHPEIMRPAHKEPMWWNRLTLGMAQSLRKPVRYYLDFFDEAAELMRRKVVMKNGKPYHPGITVDATPANLWDYDCWTDIPGNRGLAEPKYTLAHTIKKLVPNAKILMILRQPTDRLYSQYRMKSHREPSSTFHKQVQEVLTNFNSCLEKRTLRSCAYDHDISSHEFGSPGGVFLRASLYYVFVKDWLDVLPREQVMVLRTEDYHNNTGKTLEGVFNFLDLSPLSKERMATISKQRDVNTRADHHDRSMEPILPETQSLLDDFFRPYNKMLAKLLHDKRFKWNDIRQ